LRLHLLLKRHQKLLQIVNAAVDLHAVLLCDRSHVLQALHLRSAVLCRGQLLCLQGLQPFAILRQLLPKAGLHVRYALLDLGCLCRPGCLLLGSQSGQPIHPGHSVCSIVYNTTVGTLKDTNRIVIDLVTVSKSLKIPLLLIQASFQLRQSILQRC